MHKPLGHQELAKYSQRALVGLAVEQGQLLYVASQMIRRLEGEVGRLTEAVGEQNQKLLFSAERLENMRLGLAAG